MKKKRDPFIDAFGSGKTNVMAALARETIGYIRAGKVMEEFREHFARTTVRIEDGADFDGVQVAYKEPACHDCGALGDLFWNAGYFDSLFECLVCGAVVTDADWWLR